MDTSRVIPKRCAIDLIRLAPYIHSCLNEAIQEENKERAAQQHIIEDSFAKQTLTEGANRKELSVRLNLKTVAELLELFLQVECSIDTESNNVERIALPKVVFTGILRSLREIYSIMKVRDNQNFVFVPKRTIIGFTRLLDDMEIHFHKQANTESRYDYMFEEPDAAFYCGCSVSNLQKFRKEGLVKFFRYRRHVRYHKLDLDCFLSNNPQQYK